ncbi:hypothetical protein ERO13_D02G187250v2 [Gossypium hirsutum]|uniref:Uncharacterized protein n=3 Tax=Gossypium TaxID=3633 RepID=A0A0D2SKZ9_GOSRA|nr:hypothetical protein ES319_D02G215200v1 [Gossypium barbadense]KAG4159636.1 hypothetical protein ERO13_D02G187250v2 [Gossypium hirsutum]KJB31820.1 hypothetical protein B456_005G209700 [Gossypium raimondii]TYI94659.1 hypothetical protein E1A91_D02G220500v1 [Gossypium mustelinum]
MNSESNARIDFSPNPYIRHIVICLIRNINRFILNVSQEICILSPCKKSVHNVIEAEAKYYVLHHILQQYAT